LKKDISMNSPTIVTSVPSAPVELPSQLAGVKVLLEGPTGTGKTRSIGTLVDTGLEVFFLGLETGIESLIGYYTDPVTQGGKGLAAPPANLHWHVMNIPTGGFAGLALAAKDIGEMAQDSLYSMKDATRHVNNPFERFLKCIIDFEDQRTGVKFGAVDKWGPDRCIVVDGLTGMSDFAMTMVVGKKPVKSQTDWGIAQDALYRTLKIFADSCKCHFVLLAHVEREVDEVMGGTKVTVSTLGKKLPPKIPPMFSDVILAVRTAKKWTWSTANALCDLKTRNLEVADNIEPDFSLIINRWKSRGGRFSPIVK
jgi:hypothetical protein